ncbi:MAG TPA: maltose ABC transporter permease MalF [Devosia sp.]|jgi:maltose/maltodextrin transport system permease protein|nr:maltose ABC transporter permease MalF [Devosia sp.]
MAELAANAPPEAAAPMPVLGWVGKLVVAALFLGMLWISWSLYLVGEAVLAALILAAAVGFALIFGSRRFYATRFIYPGIVAITLFVAFPVIYTVVLGFTNYSSLNLLTFERARGVIMQARTIDKATERPFALARDGAAYRVFLPEGEGGGGFLSEPVPLDGAAITVPAAPVDTAPETMEMRDVVPLRNALGLVSVTLPDGVTLQQSGLRTFASVAPAWRLEDDGRLISVADGRVLTPDQSIGFYVDETGQALTPGWRVNVGLANFQRIFTSEGIRQPMLSIFVWTLVFATLSVLLTFALGVLLAVILQWPHLRFKAFYRLMLILPYAVPAFISILIFKGLFNQNFGEINMLLEALFGVRPDWNTDAFMARTMILLVNVWLGYPYMMLLAMGFLQSVPEDHKKAAALEGASSFRVFFTITLPQIIPPFLPLLIASFAFNFNNLVLILLLTRGAPDMPGTIIPAGQTDILGSFIYRIGFIDSGQQFGLSGAITFIIFVIVAAIAYGNFVVMRRVAGGVR